MLRATVAPLGPTVSSRGVFDVTAYGADPTATHDSTDAIQSAVRAAMNSATHRTMGTVLFPSGSYSISRTINVTRSAAGDSSGVVLLGSGVAEITQQCFGCDVFFGAQLWRFTARQLWLRGGRRDRLARRAGRLERRVLGGRVGEELEPRRKISSGGRRRRERRQPHRGGSGRHFLSSEKSCIWKGPVCRPFLFVELL